MQRTLTGNFRHVPVLISLEGILVLFSIFIFVTGIVMEMEGR